MVFRFRAEGTEAALGRRPQRVRIFRLNGIISKK